VSLTPCQTPRGCQWAGPPRALTAMTGAQAAIMMADSDAPISDGSIGVSILLVVPRAAVHSSLGTGSDAQKPARGPSLSGAPARAESPGSRRPGHWHWHRGTVAPWHRHGDRDAVAFDGTTCH
jgi:hypothetical protein